MICDLFHRAGVIRERIQVLGPTDEVLRLSFVYIDNFEAQLMEDMTKILGMCVWIITLGNQGLIFKFQDRTNTLCLSNNSVLSSGSRRGGYDDD